MTNANPRDEADLGVEVLLDVGVLRVNSGRWAEPERAGPARRVATGDARGLGLMCALEFVKDRESKAFFPPEAGLAARLTEGFMDKGVLLRGGVMMNIRPPLCITAGEIDELVQLMD